ncbi:ROK family transcriptional regulator [Peribacillus sp. ACCC06369]|uniref:ROK family transcriptional regulator n=1 Tax=Peribacillus sp. ACCC06369 TaxID=3055860 RepID=UPI0025A145E0|nr:ROK family transcriptional regulator [Peribacillus sp. ACCC06369]MDM5356454.1 ROK family transcriptional regulator [Peribacillus sp. ACCC06369]
MNELVATPKSIKKIILRGIRTTLLELGSATKVELSHTLGISFPTISKFLAQMEKDGEIILVGLDGSSGGRRAKRYRYNPEHMLGLAIFLEKTETNYTIFNCVGEVKEQGKAPSVLKDDGLNLLTTCIENIMTKNSKISSMAIGVPGSVDSGRIFYIPGYEQFQNFDLKGYYEDQFSIPVVVENDMNAAVLGYHNNRGIKDKQSLIYLYSGQNGPGAGIMINGDVVRGSTFFSGEVSFVPQYNDRNFRQALENGSGPKKVTICEDYEIDAISRLVASFVAIINPHTIIFSNDEVEKVILDKIAVGSSKYIPSEHLPSLTMSDWKQDYLYGLQSLGRDLMINGTNSKSVST